MQVGSFLEFKHHLYFKLASSLVLLATLAYIWHQPAGGAYGGTWLGYTLGTVAALIILLLLWLGIRKRQYGNAPGTLLGWVSAHVYLGLTLPIIATLHAAFQLGWNVHSLAYVLLWLVVISGVYGVVMYVRLPSRITVNMADDTLDTLLLQIADFDREALRLALVLPDQINTVVLRASQGTKIGGSWRRQLLGVGRRCPTAAALAALHHASPDYSAEQSMAHRGLYALMLRKHALVSRARRDVMYKAQLQFWLYLHLPLSVALLAALSAHIFSVFFYW